VRALITAQADCVWVGYAEPSASAPGLAELARFEQVTLLPLDVTRADSAREAAATIGASVDILVNNAELHRTQGIGSGSDVDMARAEMDVNYFGLLHLAREFGPIMRSRGADGQAGAVAWVNLLSVFALSSFPAHGTFCASKSAAYSLSQCLRAEMQPAGIRVVNVFPGPIDDPWNRLVPPPKLAPQVLAREVVKSLQSAVEDVYPGDVAQEWLARWRQSPKTLERELAAGRDRA
jgi:NAD(P)-dependent dehydrogenase (short-subunit alcohol dehydrogenase family)